MGYYFLIGLLYTLTNVLYRKMDTDGDWFIVLVWMLLWPICFLGLIAGFIQDKLVKNEER